MDSLTHASSGALVGLAVAQFALPNAMTSCVVLGVLAGSLPDLDFLAELRGKAAAWRYHRILSHNVPVASLLTVVLAIIAGYALNLPIIWMLGLCITATAMHLLLDVLTSFGTCLSYPFSSKRYSTRSHFIFDPIVLLICLYGLLRNNPSQALVGLSVYIVLSLILRAYMYRYIKARLPAHLSNLHLQLEPIFLAPFRWLVILKSSEGYTYCYQNLYWQSDWHAISQNAEVSEEFENICQQHDLMRWVLRTFDMPLYNLQLHKGQYFLVVEDLKWRVESDLRPLAFTLQMERVDHQWQITEASQGGFFQRNDSELFQPPIKLST